MTQDGLGRLARVFHLPGAAQPPEQGVAMSAYLLHPVSEGCVRQETGAGVPRVQEEGP